MAGFISERVAGFKLECLAGFVGIRSQSHVLDKKMGDFLKDFPGLALAVASIMVLTIFLIPKVVVLLIDHTFFG